MLCCNIATILRQFLSMQSEDVKCICCKSSKKYNARNILNGTKLSPLVVRNNYNEGVFQMGIYCILMPSDVPIRFFQLYQ